MTNLYRQGDVLLVETQAIPANAVAVPRENGRLILAHGEVTGHAHVIEALPEDATLFATADSGDRWLRVGSGAGATLTHQEHATIAIPAGTYQVLRQREYSPQAIRRVAD